MTIDEQSQQVSSGNELTTNQKRLEEELISIFSKLDNDRSSCITELTSFLNGNKSDEDLKFILDNSRDENGETWLHYAYNCLQAVELLLKAGADPNARNKDGETPLHLAATYGYTEIVEVLSKVEEVDVNAKNKNGNTPLHEAAKNDHIDVAEALLEKGADVSARNKEGETPLHLAVRYGHIEVVKTLLKKGANINAEDEYGKTPLHYAIQYDGIDIIETLIINKANVNAKDKSEKTPLYYAIEYSCMNTANKNSYIEMTSLLMNKGADPFLLERNVGNVKYLVELIKNDTLKCSEKVEETQQEKKQTRDEYEFLKYSLLSDNNSLIDCVKGDAFDHLICTWLVDVRNLTDSQKQLNTQLLIFLKVLLYPSFNDYKYGWSNDWEKYEEFEDFLQNNRSNDLETIVNLKRGESQLTILHLVSCFSQALALDMVNSLLDVGADPNKQDGRGRAPLHYVTDSEITVSLLYRQANINIRDDEGKTPLDRAIDSHHYSVAQYLLTSEQQRLKEELSYILRDDVDNCIDWCTEDSSSLNKHPTELMNERLTKLEDFLNKYKHENAEDLKKILNFRDDSGKSIAFRDARRTFADDESLYQKAERLLLEAGAIDYEELDRKEHSPKLGILWDNLIEDQQKELKTFLGEVEEAKNMNELEKAVDKAITSGLGLNFPHEGKLYDKMYERKYSFTDYVIRQIKRISESGENPKLASDIVCKLISQGAKLHNICSLCVFDELEKFEGHKVNMKKAHEDYVNRTLEFTKAAKSATSGRVEDARVDNSTIYLKCSENSTVKPAEIITGASNSGLIHGDTGYGRSVIKIGENEVEIITANGIRNYTDLADGSDIVLTFYTSQGELEVRLYPDKQDLIRVEVQDREKWEKLKNCEEEIGKNCLLGGLSVNEAIGQGLFGRSGKLMRSEAMSSSKKVLEGVGAAVEGLKPGDIVNSSSSNTSFPTKESIQIGARTQSCSG